MQGAREELPSGIVTFVFTDVEGSTRLLRRLGDPYVEVLERHFALMREAWRAHNGHELDSAGDSVFVVFADAGDAVRACAAAQRLLTQEAWPTESLRVRMGVHTGLASPRGPNYVALAVHQAARVVSAAHGGQVLVSADAAAECGPLGDIELVRVGRFRLRDFEEPVALFTIAGAGLPGDFPAVRALPADGHNLVVPPTPFVGRDDDVPQIAAMAAPGRLVTLTGAGGVGKTRLALEAGLAVADRWEDGVWFVDLAAVQDAAQIGAAVGTAVGAPALGGDRWKDVLEHLRERRALVILDSCEHLAAACGLAVDELIGTCPGCGVMATSRAPLVLRHEQVWRVAPLPLPDSDVTTAEAAASPAVQLFVERARSARQDVAFDDSTARVITAICQRLDGLPLALELAAARLGALSLPQLLSGLDDRFRVLRSQSPSIPERQRTMEALLEWSDRFLDDQERVCLRRLAVFAAGFSVDEAVAPVAAAGVEPYDVPELVWSLVDKSLVVADLGANATRYRLLESVRDFARRRLDDHRETEETALRLAAWYLERIGPACRRDRRWMGDVSVALPNLRALIPLVAAMAPEQAQQLAVTVGRYLDATHSFRDGIRELTGYSQELAAPTSARISLLACLGDLYLRSADVTSAQAVVSEAEALERQSVALPEWDDVAIERTRGDLACRSGDYRAAAEAAQRVLAGELSPRGQARMSSQLGIAALAVGDLDTARAAFEQELAAYEKLGDVAFEASAHGNLAEVAMRRGDTAGAARHQRACLALGLELGAPAMVAFSLIVAARLTAQRRDWDAAVTLHAQAQAILDTIGLALYEDDRRLSDEMLEEAERHLGESGFAAAAASAGDVDLPGAAALAHRVLASVEG